MEWWEIAIIVSLVAFVGLVIFLHFFLKKKGKSLGGDCAGNCYACSKECASKNSNLVNEYHKTYCKNKTSLKETMNK